MTRWARAFVGAGANLGAPRRQIARARDALEESPGVRRLRSSSLYRTEPVGPVPQPPFINAVFALECGLAPAELLALLLRVEEEMGRVRKERWGPRAIDLDLLLYGEAIICERGLEVPHPRLHERRFVLAPLAEVAPGFVHPLLGKSASCLLAALPPGGPWVERLLREGCGPAP